MKIHPALVVPAILTAILLIATVPIQAQTASAQGVVRASSAKKKITRPRLAGGPDVVSSEDPGRSPRSITSSVSVEKRVFDLINKRRSEFGAPPLLWNSKIADIARSHSNEMALYDYFSHTDVEGNLVDARATDEGIDKWTSIGENIAYLRGYDDPAEYAVERWMLSRSHRQNLLDPRWRETGVGLAMTSDGTYYFTQVFLVN
ncbi:MAG: CAP domain-containing protein [Acidobacteria bacterium]|nr:MAG: CAP domain-containing protein [Acidobacteriota bacterium]REK01302.1 MAG: CAP domain-containing protein [Acidobacteriota bacterium]REK14258.1 MAG: CAP domain-containing protein [Acidobacteriota bacterium]REK44973.1 MAG: CAP domain-containing protein [Acidobacteriota bacterium]